MATLCIPEEMHLGYKAALLRLSRVGVRVVCSTPGDTTVSAHAKRVGELRSLSAPASATGGPAQKNKVYALRTPCLFRGEK